MSRSGTIETLPLSHLEIANPVLNEEVVNKVAKALNASDLKTVPGLGNDALAWELDTPLATLKLSTYKPSYVKRERLLIPDYVGATQHDSLEGLLEQSTGALSLRGLSEVRLGSNSVDFVSSGLRKDGRVPILTISPNLVGIQWARVIRATS